MGGLAPPAFVLPCGYGLSHLLFWNERDHRLRLDTFLILARGASPSAVGSCWDHIHGLRRSRTHPEPGVTACHVHRPEAGFAAWRMP
jgi:hypothetical protein